jgi:single-stranded-DNA-specific exonuclease
MKTFPCTRWLIKPRPDHTDVIRLATELQLPLPLAAVLLQRGIRNRDEAAQFFNPSLTDLHDPFLMRDMDKAVDRIQRALGDGEKILVYGDYDVDGTTAVALVYSYLRSLGADCGYYIPDRYKEGYGVSFDGVDYAAANGFSLIIALDCGIKSHDKVVYAREREIDFIICDHHRPGATLPDAVAVLDPKRNDCDYPYDELCGCGIGFKLVQALHSSSGENFGSIAQYLDLVAVAIAADIVPVTGENRILAKFGLEQMNTAPRPAFKALFAVAGLKKKITITDLVFTAAPRINAAGRVDHGRGAVELLISQDATRADETAKTLNQHNNERRDLDKTITAHAIEMISSDTQFVLRKSTVVFHPDWHKGVVGIVASRLIERWYRPTIVLTGNEGKVSGSARSVRDFDVHEAIEECSELLMQFGGHKYAAGLTLQPENVEAFVKKFDEAVSRRITAEQLSPVTEVDLELSLSQIDQRFVSVLKQFEPFGPGNMNPVFLTRGLVDRGWAKLVGENHMKCDLLQPENRSVHFGAIGFGLGEFLPSLSNGKSFSACYTIEENHWNGMVTTQMNLKDVEG